MPLPEETFASYELSFTTTSTGNVVPNRATLAKAGLTGRLHRSRQAMEEAIATGRDPNTAGIFYTNDIEFARFLGPQFALLGSRGDAWAVSSEPVVRTRFVQTSHVRVLVQLMKARPSGMPCTETAYASGGGKTSQTDTLN